MTATESKTELYENLRRAAGFDANSTYPALFQHLGYRKRITEDVRTTIKKILISHANGELSTHNSITELLDLMAEYRCSKEEQESKSELCLNCKEPIGRCACMRNLCIKCGKPVGNITFTVCDDCWEKSG